MIITVTLNAAIDRSLVVPNIRLGHRHRAVEQTTLAGGKGVNVARTLKTLGQPVIATGFAGGATGTRIVEQLTRESILNDFVRINDESRTNTAVFDPTSGIQTEINEKGPRVDERELELFRDKLLYLARGADVVVMAGSLPRNVPDSVYGDLVKELHRIGVRVYADTDGEPLRHVLKAEVDAVTPNQLEAEEVIGHEFTGDEDRALAIGELLDHGVREAVMTLQDGCVAGVRTDGNGGGMAGAHPPSVRLLRARIEPRETVARIGSGDAFLAGLVAARYERRSDEEVLRYAVACGADATQRLGAGLVDPRQAERLVHEVEIEQIELPDGDD
ncbi:1-phosphofructokinase [Patulibacter medicamentivorans]|uniref:1-phosphofructokinase n=1 Tax=Patulibacter medicamentivorans TaxID=1097667 RepID=H0E0G7_9ACTN|nr:1-phosphofructokinase family hexose kinase [Patulibacter medicamentivorans]EHN12828.1 1-phosphofructokinase [Patulibacter medicamentivorans]